MSYISFYRKWRPQTFSEIVGQGHVVKTLQNAISKNRISHSYVFCGPKGTGKTSLARVFAKALNCVNGPTPDPCNKCPNCISISSGTNIDVIEIDAASNRGIDDIRDLREKVKFLPVNLQKKVYIIDEAHQITPDAFNAFLKILEEPPEHVIFILATTEPHKLLPTIMSRCQRFDFEPISMDLIRKRLKDIASIENIDINDNAVDLIARHADGSLRDSDGILEQLSSFEDTKITIDDVISLLGIVDQDMLFELANIILEKNLNQALLFTQRIYAGNLNLKVFTTEFLEHLYNLYTIKNYDKPFDILDVSEDSKEKYFNQAGIFTSSDIEYLMDLFSELLKQMRWSESSKTFFKTTILKAINFEVFNEDRVIKKINKLDESVKRLEEKLNQKGKEIIKTEEIIIEKEKKKADKEENIQATKKEDREKYTPEDPTIKDRGPKLKKEEHGTDTKKTMRGSSIQEKPEVTDRESSKNDLDHAGSILKNWSNILSRLREKNISIHAMFIETKGFKITEKALIFFLGENKNWHKEHLTKNNNKMLIQQIINEYVNKSFNVVFEIADGLKSRDMVSVTNDNINIKKEDKTGGPDKGSRDSNDDNSLEGELTGNVRADGGSKDDDILKYLEEKFEIKEQ